MTRALVLLGPDSIGVHEVVVAEPRAHEIGVRVVASGVCHSDLHVYERGGAGMLLPLVMGHEASGVVESIGDGVAGFSIGDHVIMTVFPQCGACVYCLNGHPTLCVQGQSSSAGTMQDGTTRVSLDGAQCGQMAGLGGWSERIVVPETAAVRIDPSMPLVPAALIGCGVVTGYGAAANVAKICEGETVAVIGCGGLGLSAIQASRIAKASRIIAVDTVDEKLAVAQRFGATDAVNGATESALDVIMEMTGGRGVDAALDFVAVPATARQAVAMTTRGGRIVLTGLGAQELPLEVSEFVRKGKVLYGNLMGMGVFKQEFAKLVRLYQAGELLLDEMISQRIEMTEIGAAFDAMRVGEGTRTILSIG